MRLLNKNFALLILFLLINSFLKASDDTVTKVENFKLKDYNGKEYQLNDFKNSKAIVIIFVATQCPVSNAYNSRMEKLYEEFKNKGVAFIGINSNKQESIDEIKEHAKENNLNFVILKDVNNIIADKLNAKVTPEVFVLNPEFEILYHGRIDDSRKEEEVKSEDLRNALNEILAGKKVSTTETKAFGCTIKRVN
ncbi:thioredoxin family protein [Rosettibacter firmus]|uniref:thioredoxin family protein n=1 Tax=Rosettibacter firmus TaxID=3111522 RepID=UPI00336C062F